MGKRMRKEGDVGLVTTYLSRKQALKKLQLSLRDFRRLCIIKNIYPVEPRQKKKVNKGSSQPKTFYYLKDIQFLSHEPLINKYRSLKIFLRKHKKAVMKKEYLAAGTLRDNRPVYPLDRIVLERYPRFSDSLRELDDCLTTIQMFATFPKIKGVPLEFIHECKRLINEFYLYVIETKSLRKAFISIKGFYFQADIEGETVTWIVPHNLGYSRASNVDFHIMVTFMELYKTMLKNVNAHLFKSLDIPYPLKLTEDTSASKAEEILAEGDDIDNEKIYSLSHSLRPHQEEDEYLVLNEPTDEDQDDISLAKIEADSIIKLRSLFKGLKFYLNREVPREVLVFNIKCFSGEVSWDRTTFVGASYPENDLTITHHIVDRPSVRDTYLGRQYVQPQWVFDCINARMLLSTDKYLIGKTLPSHLSPFAEEHEGAYIPPERRAIIRLQRGEQAEEDNVESENDSENEINAAEEKELAELADNIEEETKPEDLSGMESSEEEIDSEESDGEDNNNEESSEEEEDKVPARKKSKLELPQKKKPAPKKKLTQVQIAERTAAQEKRLAIMMMPKKHKKLYEKIKNTEKRRNKEVHVLERKREAIDKQKKKKAKKTN